MLLKVKKITTGVLFSVLFVVSFSSFSSPPEMVDRWAGKITLNGNYPVNWSCALFHNWRHATFKHVSYCTLWAKDVKNATVTTYWTGDTKKCTDGSAGPNFYSDYSPKAVSGTNPTPGVTTFHVTSDLYQNTVEYNHIGTAAKPAGVNVWANLKFTWINGTSFNWNDDGTRHYVSKGCV